MARRQQGLSEIIGAFSVPASRNKRERNDDREKMVTLYATFDVGIQRQARYPQRNRYGLPDWGRIKWRGAHNTWTRRSQVTVLRVSLGWLMVAVALVGFHLAVVCSSTSALGLRNLEVGLLPSVTVLTVALLSASGRRAERGRIFVRGFLASLAVAIGIYLICCLTTPDLVKRPVVYYVNEIEPSLYDADLSAAYRLSLEMQGLILGLPQLLFALAGGAVANAFARARRYAVASGTDQRIARNAMRLMRKSRGRH
jgi:hypothetical protein